ncbi:MAG: hypothetical protein CSA53_00120 [Gammaproteobacteria bacterium]|nr:MAG: hypothetical protein CSA53_00120 [Gammaproteobacteria bacterium]
MIVSHRYRFIFVKTHKTAGSSLEMSIGPLSGASDIISHMETNLDSGVPRNYGPDGKLGALYSRHKLLRKVISRHSPKLGAYYYEHMPAWRIRELVGEEVWGSYFKFCVERNPWDKVVSYYLWKVHGQNRKMLPFEQWIKRKPHRLPTDAELYFDGDHCLMDKVYEFRQLDEMIADLKIRTGIDIPKPLLREKTDIKTDRKPYQDYYNDDTRERIAQLFAREIALMGYEFSS